MNQIDIDPIQNILQWCHIGVMASQIAKYSIKTDKKEISSPVLLADAPVTSEFPSGKDNNTERVYMPWRQHYQWDCLVHYSVQVERLQWK